MKERKAKSYFYLVIKILNNIAYSITLVSVPRKALEVGFVSKFYGSLEA